MWIHTDCSGGNAPQLAWRRVFVRARIIAIADADKVASEIRVARRAGEGDHVANVRHARQKHEESFKPKTKTGVRHRAVTPKVCVPPVILWLEFMEFQVVEQLIQPFLALR